MWFTKDLVHVNRVSGKLKNVEGEVDADHAGCFDDRKSTTGFRAKLCEFLVMKSSNTQPGLPAISSGEAELRGMSKACVDMLFIQNLLMEFGFQRLQGILTSDASAAIANAGKLGCGRIRHLETQEYFVKDCVRKKLIRLNKGQTKEMTSDLLTKCARSEVFNHLFGNLGLQPAECVPSYSLTSF